MSLDFNKLTIIVVTFERPKSLDKLLRSIRRHRSACRVVVADNSKRLEPNLAADVYLKVPFDCGLSEARNRALARVETPYVCLMDDDFVLDPKAGLDKLYQAVVDGKADLAGGDFRAPPGQKPGWQAWHGLFGVENKCFRLRRGCHRKEGDLHWVDIVHNYWVATTSSVKRVRWDNDLKLQEHLDFFYRYARRRFKCVYVRGCRILHELVRTKHYKKYRDREFRQIFLKKWGLTSIDYWGKIYPRDFRK